MGRAESDITSFIEYFCTGMAKSFESVRKNIVASLENKDSATDKSDLLYHLDERQKRALDLFLKQKSSPPKMWRCFSDLVSEPPTTFVKNGLKLVLLKQVPKQRKIVVTF
jgi:hypothetical protein